jgi:GNAT superfamily N-acetyltransferase
MTSALLAAALDDGPAYAFLFPHRQERRLGLEDFFARNLRTHLPYRCTHVALIGPAVVATVTMRPPGGISISLFTMIRGGLLSFALTHGPGAIRRLLAVKEKYDAIEARLARSERHWLVHMMAVDPTRQGEGLGSRLLACILDLTVDARITRGHALAILTTHRKRNVLFYERAGFEVIGVEDVSMLSEAPYPVWSMRRRPRRAGAANQVHAPP